MVKQRHTFNQFSVKTSEALSLTAGSMTYEWQSAGRL